MIRAIVRWFTSPDNPDDKLLNAAKRIGVLIPIGVVILGGMNLLSGSGADPEPCEFDSSLLATDSQCVAPEPCEFDSSLLATDSQCVAPEPCEFDSSLLATDSVCADLDRISRLSTDITIIDIDPSAQFLGVGAELIVRFNYEADFPGSGQVERVRTCLDLDIVGDVEWDSVAECSLRVDSSCVASPCRLHSAEIVSGEGLVRSATVTDEVQAGDGRWVVVGQATAEVNKQVVVPVG